MSATVDPTTAGPEHVAVTDPTDVRHDDRRRRLDARRGNVTEEEKTMTAIAWRTPTSLAEILDWFDAPFARRTEPASTNTGRDETKGVDDARPTR